MIHEVINDLNSGGSLAEVLFKGTQISPSVDWQRLSSLPVTDSHIPTFEGVISSIPTDQKKFLLPQTGMDLRRQVKMWIDCWTDGVSLGKSKEVVKKEIIRNNVEDAQRFCQEYVYSQLVLNIPIRLGFHEGHIKLVPSNYSGEKYLDTIADIEQNGFEEREGTVKKSIEKIEEFLVHAAPGSMAVMTSPPGWSGMEDDDGIPLQHEDTQTYVFKINKIGELEAFTLRTDLTLDQNEELVSLMSTISLDKNLPEKERIKNVVSSLTLLKPTDEITTVEQVIEKIKLIKRSDNAFEKGKDENGNLKKERSFDEMSETLRNLSKISELPSNAQKKLGAYLLISGDKFDDLSPETLKQMALFLGKTILDIFADEKPQSREIFSQYIRRFEDLYPKFNYEDSYIQALQKLQKIGGCAGGNCSLDGQTSSTTTSIGLISPRAFMVSKPENQPFKTFCPMCNTIVEAIRVGNTLQCLKNKEHKKTFG